MNIPLGALELRNLIFIKCEKGWNKSLDKIEKTGMKKNKIRVKVDPVEAPVLSFSFWRHNIEINFSNMNYEHIVISSHVYLYLIDTRQNENGL